MGAVILRKSLTAFPLFCAEQVLTKAAIGTQTPAHSAVTEQVTLADQGDRWEGGACSTQTEYGVCLMHPDVKRDCNEKRYTLQASLRCSWIGKQIRKLFCLLVHVGSA